MDTAARTAILLGEELHMLHYIFEFLPLGALGQAARACAHWRAEYRSIVPRDVTHHNDNIICISAAYDGVPISTMEYLHARGCPWSGRTMKAAAHGGHLELAKYLHAHGCPWDSSAAIEAAVTGRHEMLDWLRTNGCPTGGILRRT